MPEKPTLCPTCWDNMLEPVEGVKLVAVHAASESVISPALLFRCRQWHVCAVFSCDPFKGFQA